MKAFNLPEGTYSRFFGRTRVLEDIKKNLIEGGTFMVSLDGAGGIGKTALAHYFCKTYVLPASSFDYLVWISAKRARFDLEEGKAKPIKTNSFGLDTLVDTTLMVCGQGDRNFLNYDAKEKQELFQDVLHRDAVFFVLDNLETIEDDAFFKFVMNCFNKAASTNKQLKALTTSRRRKKLMDFPIEVGGLELEDALMLLKYLASEYDVRAVANATDYQNAQLLKRLGCIPLAIEYTIYQMRRGKSLGDILRSLEGFSGAGNERMTQNDLISFCFRDTYEALDDVEQLVFKAIAALQRHLKGDKDQLLLYYRDVLMTITNLGPGAIESALGNLVDSKLIISNGLGGYDLPELGADFVAKYLDDNDFDNLENHVAGLVGSFRVTGRNAVNPAIIWARELCDMGSYEEAETCLQRLVDARDDDVRLLVELAEIQLKQNKYRSALNNLLRAVHLMPNSASVWEKLIAIEMEKGLYNMAFEHARDALDKTNADIRIAFQIVVMHKQAGRMDRMRRFYEQMIGKYKEGGDRSKLLTWLRKIKNMEYELLDEVKSPKYYYAIGDELAVSEIDFVAKYSLLGEMVRTAREFADLKKAQSLQRMRDMLRQHNVLNINGIIRSINKHSSQKEYDEVIRLSKQQLSLLENGVAQKDAAAILRALLNARAARKEYELLCREFRDYEVYGRADKSCVDMYNKGERVLREKHLLEIQKEMRDAVLGAELVLRKCAWRLHGESKFLALCRKNIEPARMVVVEERLAGKSERYDKEFGIIGGLDFSDLGWLVKSLREYSDDPKVAEGIKKILRYLEDANYIRNDSVHGIYAVVDGFSDEELYGILAQANNFKKMAEELVQRLGGGNI